MSVGVKVTLCGAVPAPGARVGLVKAKLPGVLADPPLKVAEASVCPKLIALAVGQAVTVALALLTVRLAVLLVTLLHWLATTTA